MQWDDQAIVVQVNPFGEHAAIVAMLTSSHGLVKAMVRSIRSPKLRGIYQPGNLVEVRWQARLAEQLGTWTAESRYPYAALLMSDKLKLYALQSLLSILVAVFPERQPCETFFYHVVAWLENLSSDTTTAWLHNYVKLELELLTELGYGLTLDRCCVTGSEDDIAYVSPKTACAVSRSVGEGYRDKLLPLPEFLREDKGSGVIKADLGQGLELTSYFLIRHVFQGNKEKPPEARRRFTALVLSVL